MACAAQGFMAVDRTDAARAHPDYTRNEHYGFIPLPTTARILSLNSDVFSTPCFRHCVILDAGDHGKTGKIFAPKKWPHVGCLSL